MKTDEVCGRPLDPFAVHTRVSWFCMLHGDERYTNYSNSQNSGQ